jgi:DNA-directed RNA polymerase specialized sigma24 family protein
MGSTLQFYRPDNIRHLLREYGTLAEGVFPYRTEAEVGPERTQRARRFDAKWEMPTVVKADLDVALRKLDSRSRIAVAQHYILGRSLRAIGKYFGLMGYEVRVLLDKAIWQMAVSLGWQA